MDIDANTRNWIITGAIVIIIVLLGWWLVARNRSTSPVMNDGSATTTQETDSSSATDSGTGATSNPETGTSVGGNSNSAPLPLATAAGETISVSDQPAGSYVMIASVKVTKPSWVAIKDTKGWVLGAARVDVSAEAVQVPLLRNTTAGQNYQALIYVDDGDKQFDFHKDLLVTNSEGAPVAATFSALNGD